jgi:hypothetical protein
MTAASVWALAKARQRLGKAEPMSRGALQWLISIPEDGGLPFDGAAPALIQWQTEAHPAAGLQDMGCRLIALELRHPDAESVRALLDDLDVVAPSIALLSPPMQN